MANRWITLPLIFYAASSFAQTDSTYLDIILHEIRRIQSSRTIHYAPDANFNMSKSCEDLLRKKIYAPGSNNQLQLTTRERKYLLQEVEASKDSTWPDHLFPDSKLAGDTIHHTLNQLNRAMWDSVMASGNKDLIRKGYGIRFYYRYWFSRPVYLRNRSVLFFCFTWYHNSSGETALHIYRKEGNTYKYWAYICGGAW